MSKILTKRNITTEIKGFPISNGRAKIISFSLLMLFIVSFLLPFTASAQIVMPIREIKRTVGSTTFSFQGQIVDTPPKITPTLYFYYGKDTESTAGAIDATREEITTSSLTKDFTMLLGIGGGTALTPDTDYTFFITDQNPIETIGGAYTVKMFDSFHTKKTGESATSSNAELPAVTTNSTAINIIVNAGTVRGTITGTDSSSKVWFKYGIKESALDKTTPQAVKTKDGEFSATISGLTEKITIYFKACGKNTKGESCGNTYNFYPSITGGTGPITGGTGPITDETTTTTSTPAKTELNYYPLAPLTGVGEKCEDDGTGKTVCVKLAPQVCETDKSGKETCRPCTADDSASECKPGLGFAGYLNAMIKIFIGICAVLAMIMIVMGGIQYMTSELVSGKAAGKEQITHAILGLLLALGAYAILNTINPNLLDVSLSGLPTATITLVGTEIPGTSGIAPDGNCNPTIIKPATTAGNEILAKAPGAQGNSCWGGANAAYVAAGYVASGGHSDSCPTSVAPGDILTYYNGNSFDTQGYHSVIFDSINSDGSWKLWSQGNSGVKMSVLTDMDQISASAMSKNLVYSWKPFKCRAGQVPQMDDINNNGVCSGAGASTLTTEKLTSVTFYYTGTYFTFAIDGFDDKKQYRYRVYEADTSNSLIGGNIDKNLTGNTLSSAEYNKIRTKKVDVTAYNVSGSLIGIIEDYQM